MKLAMCDMRTRWSNSRKPTLTKILCSGEYCNIVMKPIFNVGEDTIVRVTAKDKKSGQVVSVECTELYYRLLEKRIKKYL